MAVVARLGSRVMTGLAATPKTIAPAGAAGGIVRNWTDTVETASDDSATSTYDLARLPSNSRLSHTSTIYWDDLASSGSPTLDIGLFPVRTGDFTGDDDCIRADMDAATVNVVGIRMIADPSKLGLMLWQIVGLTADPKCEMFLRVTLKDAAVNIAATLTTAVDYIVD